MNRKTIVWKCAAEIERLKARTARKLADILARRAKIEQEIQRRDEERRDCERAEKERLQRKKDAEKHKYEMELRKTQNFKRKKEDEALRQLRDLRHNLLGSIALANEHSEIIRRENEEKRKHDDLLETRKTTSIQARIGVQKWRENKKKQEETTQLEEYKKSLEAWSSRTGISYLSHGKVLAFESDSKIPAYSDVSSSKHVSQDVVVGTVRPTKALNIRSGQIGVDSESLPSRGSQMNVTSDRLYSIKTEEDIRRSQTITTTFDGAVECKASSAPPLDAFVSMKKGVSALTTYDRERCHPRHNLSFVSTTHDQAHVMGGISRSFKRPDSTRVSQVYKGGESHDVQLIDDVRAGLLREKNSELLRAEKKAQSRGRAALREQNKVKSIQMLDSTLKKKSVEPRKWTKEVEEEDSHHKDIISESQIASDISSVHEEREGDDQGLFFDMSVQDDIKQKQALYLEDDAFVSMKKGVSALTTYDRER
ncbi:hypothetical protein ADUPG1_009870, partial [Aduncisulcus paluster]